MSLGVSRLQLSVYFRLFVLSLFVPCKEPVMGISVQGVDIRMDEVALYLIRSMTHLGQYLPYRLQQLYWILGRDLSLHPLPDNLTGMTTH